MPPVGFEPTISAGERPKTYALDRATTGTGFTITISFLIQTESKQVKKNTYCQLHGEKFEKLTQSRLLTTFPTLYGN